MPNNERPLTDREKRERGEAREAGRKMARETLNKLRPEIEAIAGVINKHDERLIMETASIVRREVLEEIEKELKTLITFGGNQISAAHNRGVKECIEAVKSLKAKKGIPILESDPETIGNELINEAKLEKGG